MSERKTRRAGLWVGLACLLVAGTVGVSVAAPAATPPGNITASDGPRFAVHQGSTCTEVTPLGNGERSVESFYNYELGFEGRATYSSVGTAPLQQDGVSQLFVYNGSEGLSLVFLHDRWRADGSETGGGVVSMDLTGLPTDGEWVVEDDTYHQRDDLFDHNGSTSHIEWLWAGARTDGAVFRGLDPAGGPVVIDPAFNNASSQYPYEGWVGDPSENELEAWVARSGTDDLQSLALDERVRIYPGPCDQEPPTASLDADRDAVDAGHDVVLDASGTSENRAVEAYEWDTDGDGEMDRKTSRPTLTITPTKPGNYSLSVRAVDIANNSDTANVDLRVRDVADRPPTAVVSLPDAANVSAPVTLDATDSSDDGDIVEYRWDFDNDGVTDRTTEEPTVEYRFPVVGQRSVGLTTVDDGGQTDNETVSLTIVDEEAPAPRISASEWTVGVGDAVTFDATRTTDNNRIVSYNWSFGDSGIASGVFVKHRYAAPGTYNVTLQVTDAAGNREKRTVSIQVGADGTVDGDAPTDEAPRNAERVLVRQYEPNGFTVEVVGPEANAAAGGDIPAQASADETGVRLERVTGIINTTPERYGIRVDTNASLPRDIPGPPSGTHLLYTTLIGRGTAFNESMFQSATMRFSVERARLEAAGIDPQSVTLYQYRGGPWVERETNRIATTEDRVYYEVTVPTLSTMVLAAPRVAISTSTFGVERRTVRDRDPVSFTAAVRNAGADPGQTAVQLRVEGQVVDQRRVTVPGNATRLVRFTHQFDSPGRYRVSVGDQTIRVDVRDSIGQYQVTDLRINRTSLAAGEVAQLVATVKNNGAIPTVYEAELVAFGEVVDTRRVVVAGNGTRTVVFDQRFGSPGTHTVSVGNQSVTVEVSGEVGASDPGDSVFDPDVGGLWLGIIATTIVVGGGIGLRLYLRL